MKSAALIATPDDFARTFSVSRETVERLETYAALLRLWQKTINLVAPSTLDDVWHRHFADSAQLLALAPPAAERWLDLGSGAGFPGLVLAILLADRGSSRVTLIESDTRKAAFLARGCAQDRRRCGHPAERIEKARLKLSLALWMSSRRARWHRLPRLLDLSAPFFSDHTMGLFLKGREAEAEVEAARKLWDVRALS